VRVLEAAQGPGHTDLATALNGLGVVHHARGEAKEAEASYRRALATFERRPRPTLDAGFTARNLADLVLGRGDVDEAARLYAQALPWVEQVHGADAPELTFRAYLFACARNVLVDHLRGQYRNREDFDPSRLSIADLGTTPSEFAARRREHRLLLEALRRLPVDYQVAIELHDWEGLTGSEVASTLGVPEGTVRTHLARGRKALAERLAELEPGALAQSTIDNLERWATSLREQLQPARP
jgi:RNA polymerase sigma-70 factor (ECF subfamily)